MGGPQVDPKLALQLGPQWRFHGLFSRIAPRLLVGFVLSIALTVVMGVVAIQRLSALTAATTELAAKDLPEVFRVSQLRSSLYRQLNLPRAPCKTLAPMVNSRPSCRSSRT
jgi:Mg2+/citrate symporter